MECFSVHDLYPKDYCFDYETFEADPENYKFTVKAPTYLNALELEHYETAVPMTPYERHLLRKWSSPAIVSMTILAPAIPVSPDTIRSAISSMFTA